MGKLKWGKKRKEKEGELKEIESSRRSKRGRREGSGHLHWAFDWRVISDRTGPQVFVLSPVLPQDIHWTSQAVILWRGGWVIRFLGNYFGDSLSAHC